MTTKNIPLSMLNAPVDQSPLSVLLVNKFFWRKGGSEAVFFDEMALLQEHGHTVIPFSMKSENNQTSAFEKYFVSEVDYTTTKKLDKMRAALRVLYSVEAAKKMEQLLQAEDVELSHFHIFQHQITPSVFGPLVRREIPIVLTLHDLKPICPNYKMYSKGKICERCLGGKFYNCLLRKCTKNSLLMSMINTLEMYLHHVLGFYSQVDMYIAVSDFYRQKIIESGVDPRKVKLVRNYVDASKFEPDYSGGEYIIYFGRLSEEKGLPTLIKAMEIRRDIQLIIVGTGPEEMQLKKMVRDSQLSNVEFLGYRSGAELHALIQNSCFTIIPSEWYENCPMSVLEANALGKPAVGARVGGIPELISDGVDGSIFDIGDSIALADSIGRLWDSPETTKEMGRLARQKIEYEFTVDKHYEAMLQVYSKAIENRKGRA